MDNKQIKKAKNIIDTTDAVFAYVSDDKEIVSDAKGIGFVAQLCNEGRNFSEGAVADKIVGKAAALLFVLLGVKTVYAETISIGAISVFERYAVSFSYGTKTESITNRRGDGLCPMENAVKNIDDPTAALMAINNTLTELRSKS